MSDKPQLSVVPLFENDLNDVPAMLRKTADDLERGNLMPCRSATLVLEFEDSDVGVFGWADTGVLRSLGLLHLGLQKLAAMRLMRLNNFEDME